MWQWSFPGMLWLLLLGILVISNVEATTNRQRTIHRLVGGHMNLGTSDDTELIASSAGAGRDSRQQKDGGGGEEKKTLSQQVADGKYGLIQSEIFSKPSKRPGVLSYDINPDVPADNINSLGGVTKNDIWLAENHLLVLKGGSFPVYDPQAENSPPVWPPLDDYLAPNRQVKIPSHPAVPPPFPVQLEDDGPLQILGTNSTTTLNGSFAAPPYTLPTLEGGFYPGFPPSAYSYPYPANATAGDTPFPVPAYPETAPPYNPAFPLNGTFLASLPPGAAILPPPGNVTDYYDEDDPSIYYPPPYSFYYPTDNTTRVPPGPLVPGIVLPPPPDFFAPLEPNKKKKKRPPAPPITTSTTTSTTTTQRTTTHGYVNIYKTTSEPNRQINPTTTPLPVTIISKTPTVETTTKSPRIVTIYPVKYQPNRTVYLTTVKPKVAAAPDRRKRPPIVTILKPVKPTTQPPLYYYENNDVSGGRPFEIYGPPSKPRTAISSTQIPLRAYFSTSNEIESNSVTQVPPPNNGYYQQPVKLPKSTTKAPTRYYFYEEDAITNSITTAKPQSNQYFNIPKEYFVPAKDSNRGSYQQQSHQQQPARQPQQQQQQYYYVTNRPYNTQRPTSRYRFVQATKKPDTFSIHVARLKQQIHEYYPKQPQRSNYQQQPQQHLQQQPQHLQQPQQHLQQQPQQHLQQQPPQIQQQSQPQQYENSQRYVPSPKPVYQFSFEAANYKQQQQQQQNKFRQPDLQENFRPMPKYSVQIQQAVEVLPTEEPVYQNTPSPIYYQPPQKSVSSERAVPLKYYTTSSRPDYEYEDVVDVQQQQQQQHDSNKYVATPRPITQYRYQATQSPIYQPYYTKQDESYFDDITKKYFTIFGKKIPSGTTPLAHHLVEETSTVNPRQLHQYSGVRNKPVSLASDTLVNYARPRPPINPNAEYIRQRPPEAYQTQYLQNNAGVGYDSGYNSNKDTRTKTQAINGPVKLAPTAEGKPGSYISYELPGDDGAHFYFLTPQLAQSREQGAGFFYSAKQQPANQQQSTREQRDISSSGSNSSSS